MLTLETTLQIPADVLFHELAGEAVLLHLESGKYFGLDETGTRMWMLIAEHGRLEPVMQALLEEYDVSEEQLRKDLFELVERLVANGLMTVA